MQGFIRQRGQSWELRVYLGTDPLTGRQRYANRSVRGPRHQGELVLKEMIAAATAGATHQAGATFGELAETWLRHARSHLAANTAVETRRILDRYLLPRLGQVPLAALHPEHLDDLYACLLRDGAGNGKALTASTVQRVHGVARRALTVGMRWGWIATNPAFVAMPPRQVRRAIRPPSPAEVARLLETARQRDPDLATFLLLAATSGARRGELCGLRWSDVDFDEGNLDIVRAVIIVGGDAQVAPTKSRRARHIALDAMTITTLREHQHRANARARGACVELSAGAFVFSHDDGGEQPWRPDSTSRAVRHLRHEVGLDTLRLHDLRHFVATRLLTSGIDVRTVAGRLGHSTTSTTLNVYAAFVPDADRRAAEVMSMLIAEPDRRPTPPAPAVSANGAANGPTDADTTSTGAAGSGRQHQR